MALSTYSKHLSDLPALISFVKEEGRKGPITFHMKEEGSFSLCITLLSELLSLPLETHSSIDDAVDAASSLSLFQEPKIHVVLGATAPVPSVSLDSGYLLIATSKKGGIPQHGALIDFSTEKPWDTPKRVGAWSQALFQRKKMSVSTQAVALLVEGCADDVMQLWQEVEKLTLYAQEKKAIDEKDVRAVCRFVHSEKEWQLAENLIWDLDTSIPHIEDASLLHKFIGLLRYHLTLGVHLASASNPLQELQEKYPKLLKKGEKKYLPKIREKKVGYFIRGHALVAELETKLKSAMLPFNHVWESFVIELRRIS